MLVDESGFYPRPAVHSTWAPIGQTPVLREWQTRDHLSVISGITRDGRSAFPIHETAINGPLAVRFLKHLRRWIDDRRLVIWDGSTIYRSRVVKDGLRQTEGRVWRERRPGDAPDLNPDEAVWNPLKHIQLANICSPDRPTHRQELINAIRRFRRREDLIPAFFKAAGL